MAEVDNPFDAFEGKDKLDTEDVRTLLGQTQPWLIVFGCFMALGALGMAMGATVMGFMGVAGMFGASASEESAAALGVGGLFSLLVLIYVMGAALYGALAYFLLRQATAIATFRREGGAAPLAAVLRAHRDFWRVAGMSMVAVMLLYCGGIAVFGMLGAAGSAFME